ncbi:oligosaccharide flippase family protein [Granulosicoccaceae sp. 1_MG-2023]|nr:oligosaccharide flippase family protein [Granulosicoccaceae sp. 1_MG-2023]
MSKELYKGSLQVLILRVSWAVIGFAGQIIIARAVGVDAYGQYSLILAWLAVLCLFARLGFDESSVKFVSRASQDGNAGVMHAFLRYAVRYALVAGLALALLGMLLLWWWRPQESHTTAWLLGLAMLPLMALNNIRQGSLRGLRRFLHSQLGDSAIRPLLVIVLVLLASRGLQQPLSLEALMWISLAALIFAFVLGGVWLKRALPAAEPLAVDAGTRREWLRTSAWMALLSSSILILNRTDILMLGVFVPAESVGLYAAATKIATLFTFGLAAVNMSIAPLLSRAHASGDHGQLGRLMQKGTLISLAVSLVLVLAMWIAGDFALGLFGETFLQARSVFYLLAASHVVSALVGPTGALMNMTGHHKAYALLLGAAALVNVLLNVVLIPAMGIEGAALATLISATLWKIYSVFYVRRRLGIRPGVMSLWQGRAAV